MSPTIIKPQQGIILISEPSLSDFYFKQSVVLLAEHNEEGTFGIIINKPIETKINQVIPDFPEIKLPLFLGGPVKTNSLFFIHTRDEISNSLRIMDGLYWGGDIEEVKEYLKLGIVTDSDIRFFIGYSGWSPNQLDREIKDKSWVLSHTTVDKIINPNPKHLWPAYLKNMGSDYAIWANFPADPLYN